MNSTLAPAEFFFRVQPAQLDGAVSVTSGFLASLGKNVKSTIQRYRFAQNTRKVCTSLQELIDTFYAATSDSAVKEAQAKTLTPDELDHGLRSLEYLEMIVGRMVSNLKRYGWANDSKTAATVLKLDRQHEELADIVDWLHTHIRNSAETLKSLFEDARREYEIGESYTMDEVF